ncbi:hypothetical protein AC26_1840 [Escherichia coli 1-176-05_S3_C2]|nr:hypothetical protein AC26_1840 [Escherichia coli 1-176-05_S3_C2]
MPDALRLSCLKGESQLINLHIRVGRIRRLRRIRQDEADVVSYLNPAPAGLFCSLFTDYPK